MPFVLLSENFLSVSHMCLHKPIQWSSPPDMRRMSLTSQVSTTSSICTPNGRDTKKVTKQRCRDRLQKIESQHSDLDLGHMESGDDLPPLLIPPTEGSLSRGSSDQSGSVLYCKTLHPPRNGTLLAKSSSLIFPTGVEGAGNDESESTIVKRRKVNLLLDQCETVRFGRKKLVLDNMALSCNDIPLKDLLGTPLGNSLQKLSLVGNRLTVVPEKLVQSLPLLKHLDLSQCDLVRLPERWFLPQLKILNLSHNRIMEFPDEVSMNMPYFSFTSCVPLSNYLINPLKYNRLFLKESSPFKNSTCSEIE